jgi:hypothetical protein
MLEIFMNTQPSSESQDRFDYHIRFQVSPNSPDAILCNYLRNQPNAIYSQKEMVLSALRAYWTPIAYEHYRHHLNVPVTDEQLRHMACNAIAHLRERAEMLNHHFCAELTRTPILPFGPEERSYFMSQQPNIASSVPDPDWLISQDFESF